MKIFQVLNDLQYSGNTSTSQGIWGGLVSLELPGRDLPTALDQASGLPWFI